MMFKLLRLKGGVWWFCWLVGLGLTACNAPAVPSDNGLLFSEGFAPDTLAAWQLEGDEAARSLVREERLIIEVDEANVVQFVTMPDQAFDNFSLTVEARLLEGALSSSYGVLTRMQSPTAFYRFEITGDGFYLIERRNGDGSTLFLVEDWTESPAINQGLGVLNRLQVEAVGPTLSFYVNDTLLAEVNDIRYTTGTVGLDAGTFGGDRVQVAFDNVTIRQPAAE